MLRKQPANSPSGIFRISIEARNNVNVCMVDGLARRNSVIEAHIESPGFILESKRVPNISHEVPYVCLDCRTKRKEACLVDLGDDERMAGCNRIAIPLGNGVLRLCADIAFRQVAEWAAGSTGRGGSTPVLR